MASTTRLVRRADRPPTTDVGSPIPEANVRSRHPRTRFDSSTRLPSPKCPDSQVRALPHYRRLIQPAAPCFGVTVLSGKKTPPKCPPPRWLTADEHSELALSPFLTNLDPRHIPRVSTRLAKPPQVDFDVDFEPVSYQDTTPAYTATIAKRVATICANVPPPADPYPLDEWALKRTPVYLRPTLPTVLQLAQERYLYLRSEHGGSITLPALIGLGATRVSREEQGAHTLDWRISASLQQLCDLTSLWPADPLCAPPHFETWLEPSSPPPCSRALIDLTNLTHDERRAFIARGPSPTHACVYVTFSNRSLKASLLRAGLVCVHTFPPEERVLYHPKWWQTGNHATTPSPSSLTIWASPDLLPYLTPRCFSFALAHYPTPFAPSSMRYDAYSVHTRVGSTRTPAEWLLATDGSVSLHKSPTGSPSQHMSAGVVISHPVGASWEDCFDASNAYQASFDTPAGLRCPSPSLSPHPPSLSASPSPTPPAPPSPNPHLDLTMVFEFERRAADVPFDPLRPTPPPLSPVSHLSRESSPPELSPPVVPLPTATQRCFTYGIGGSPSSLRAELGAILYGLYAVPRFVPLLIATDSLSAIYLLCRWNRNTDFAPYVDAATCHDLVIRILLLLQARKQSGGTTRFIFTRSHHGEPYNEAADRMASFLAAADTTSSPPPLGLQIGTRLTKSIADVVYSIPDPLSFRPWSKSVQKGWARAIRSNLVARTERDPPRTAEFLLRKGMGRHHLGAILNKVNSWTARTFYRAITYQLPTQTRLVQWGKATCSVCTLCGTQPETLSHTLTRCPALHDAITKAHDTTFRTVEHILSHHLSSSYECHWATQAGVLFPRLVNLTATHQSTLDPILTGATRDPSLPERNVPDGILISTDSTRNHIVLIEFARTSDDTLHFSGLSRARKELKYLPLRRALLLLYPCSTIDICPLIIGTRASLPEAEWRSALSCLSDALPLSVFPMIFRAAITGTVIALSDIWRVRQAVRASHPATHPGPPPVASARAPAMARALTP